MTCLHQIRSDIPLTEDQQERLERMVYGEGYFDHKSEYTGADGMKKTLKAIHLVRSPLDADGGRTDLAEIDDIKFASGEEPFLYLESQDGSIDGWRSCRGATPSTHQYGLILQDEVGQMWICGPETYTGDEITGEEPLRRISSQTVPMVALQNGLLIENLPAEGEFWISNDLDPTITAIPWWSNFDPDDPNINDDFREEMRGVLSRISERISEMRDPVPEI